MRTAQTLSILSLLLLSLIAPFAVSAQPDVTIIIVNPRTGTVQQGTIPQGSGLADGVRAMLGLIPAEEQAALTHYLTQEEVLQKKSACLFLGKSARGYLDPKLTRWNGIVFHAGIFPLLETPLPQVVMTVFRDRKHHAADGQYEVVYFPAGAMTTEWQTTQRAQDTSGYDVEPEVPQACPKP